ncbi:MAG: metabolite traffic protein EboE [Planctomycetes bacterium]|nr:metabolite traffic protein EboE [Planctomycetota bacterium]MCP4839198.1 metabolite traffic protein EboE [Planctomycetota bacterium]
MLPTRSTDDLADALTAMTTCIPAGAPIGLWLPDGVLGENPAEAVAPIAKALARINTPLLGLNAFPQGDFHRDHVKDDVYLPAWDNPARLSYTLRAAEALVALTCPGDEIGLTTVPLGWPSHDIDIEAAADLMKQACDSLERLGSKNDRELFLAVEPEPCCLLPTATTLAEFVSTTSLQGAARRGTLRACLDACHLAVEHEEPTVAVNALTDAGIRIGRVQVSSAPEADSPKGIKAMQSLNEGRWMHQTSVLRGGTLSMYDDLPETFDLDQAGLWRTHLHVPVHRATFGELGSTQSWIAALLSAVSDSGQRPPVEVETYAWNVLPPSFRLSTVQAEIARELEWTAGIMQEVDW